MTSRPGDTESVPRLGTAALIGFLLLAGMELLLAGVILGSLAAFTVTGYGGYAVAGLIAALGMLTSGAWFVRPVMWLLGKTLRIDAARVRPTGDPGAPRRGR